MKKIFFIILIIGFSDISAKCMGYIVNGRCVGTEIGSSSNNNGYKSSSGLKYQYNLNNPSDRLNYKMDLDAQRRDSLNVEPSRRLDRGHGQNGGGIYGY